MKNIAPTIIWDPSQKWSEGLRQRGAQRARNRRLGLQRLDSGFLRLRFLRRCSWQAGQASTEWRPFVIFFRGRGCKDISKRSQMGCFCLDIGPL